MKRDIVLSILICGFILLSCEKEKYKETRIQEIKVGDYSNMIINKYNDTLKKWGDLNIDLDNNGIDDIQFECAVLYDKAWSYHHRTTVRSLSENVEFMGIFSPDTMFLNKDTVIDTTGTGVRIWELYNHTCQQFSENDTILSITQTFKLKSLEEGEVLETPDTYNTGKIIIFESPGLGTPVELGRNTDTLWLRRHPSYQDCNNFPLDEIKYIGVRFKNELRLGWIKFLLPAEDQILIMESGIQR